MTNTYIISQVLILRVDTATYKVTLESRHGIVYPKCVQHKVLYTTHLKTESRLTLTLITARLWRVLVESSLGPDSLWNFQRWCHGCHSMSLPVECPGALVTGSSGELSHRSVLLSRHGYIRRVRAGCRIFDFKNRNSTVVFRHKNTASKFRYNSGDFSPPNLLCSFLLEVQC